MEAPCPENNGEANLHRICNGDACRLQHSLDVCSGEGTDPEEDVRGYFVPLDLGRGILLIGKQKVPTA